MSNVLKFPNTDHTKPFSAKLDTVLRSLGIPAESRQKATQCAEEIGQSYRIPCIDISIGMPEGLTDEQVEHLRLEIHREFARYGDELRLAKHTYIITEVRKKIGFLE